jgi:hypothetical protein
MGFFPDFFETQAPDGSEPTSGTVRVQEGDAAGDPGSTVNADSECT